MPTVRAVLFGALCLIVLDFLLDCALYFKLIPTITIWTFGARTLLLLVAFGLRLFSHRYVRDLLDRVSITAYHTGRRDVSREAKERIEARLQRRIKDATPPEWHHGGGR